MGVLGPLGMAHDDTVNWVLGVIALILRCTVGRLFFYAAAYLRCSFSVISYSVFLGFVVFQAPSSMLHRTTYYLEAT